MNNELRNLWVEALRSGKYKQGKGRLRDGDTYCCLGVLCDLVAADNSDAYEWQEIEEDDPYWHKQELGDPENPYKILDHFDNDYQEFDLPTAIVSAIGLHSENGDFEVPEVIDKDRLGSLEKHMYGPDFASLQVLNDKGWTFAQIADLLENEPQALFDLEGKE